MGPHVVHALPRYNFATVNRFTDKLSHRRLLCSGVLPPDYIIIPSAALLSSDDTGIFPSFF
jgi:hypothetical protein